jgi:hypothetical protein
MNAATPAIPRLLRQVAVAAEPVLNGFVAPWDVVLTVLLWTALCRTGSVFGQGLGYSEMEVNNA